jgi:hypothetical protein
MHFSSDEGLLIWGYGCDYQPLVLPPSSNPVNIHEQLLDGLGTNPQDLL